jgi:hypothetical protein
VIYLFVVAVRLFAAIFMLWAMLYVVVFIVSFVYVGFENKRAVRLGRPRVPRRVAEELDACLIVLGGRALWQVGSYFPRLSGVLGRWGPGERSR